MLRPFSRASLVSLKLEKQSNLLNEIERGRQETCPSVPSRFASFDAEIRPGPPLILGFWWRWRRRRRWAFRRAFWTGGWLWGALFLFLRARLRSFPLRRALFPEISFCHCEFSFNLLG